MHGKLFSAALLSRGFFQIEQNAPLQKHARNDNVDLLLCSKHVRHVQQLTEACEHARIWKLAAQRHTVGLMVSNYGVDSLKISPSSARRYFWLNVLFTLFRHKCQGQVWASEILRFKFWQSRSWFDNVGQSRSLTLLTMIQTPSDDLQQAIAHQVFGYIQILVIFFFSMKLPVELDSVKCFDRGQSIDGISHFSAGLCFASSRYTTIDGGKWNGFSNSHFSQQCFDLYLRKCFFPLPSLICLYHARAENLPPHGDHCALTASCRSMIDWHALTDTWMLSNRSFIVYNKQTQSVDICVVVCYIISLVQQSFLYNNI